MQKSIGIPKALYYFEYYPFWKTFFEGIGLRVITSDFTNKKILADGINKCADEACLPMKSLFGHVVNLLDKSDYIFLPRLTSLSKGEYICPMVGGMPDMIRKGIKNLPIIIDVEIDLRKNSKSKNYLYEIGELLQIDAKTIKVAYERSLEAQRDSKEELRARMLPDHIPFSKNYNFSKKENGLNIIIMGHLYNIYDNHINMNVLKKLMDYDFINIITMDMLESFENMAPCSFLQKRMFWKYGRQATKVVESIVKEKKADGVIYLSSFGCGIDSFVVYIANREISQSGIPFILLNFDEQSGEAGLITRLDAFIDILVWRKKFENNLPSYG